MYMQTSSDAHTSEFRPDGASPAFLLLCWLMNDCAWLIYLYPAIFHARLCLAHLFVILVIHAPSMQVHLANIPVISCTIVPGSFVLDSRDLMHDCTTLICLYSCTSCTIVPGSLNYHSSCDLMHDCAGLLRLLLLLLFILFIFLLLFFFIIIILND